ncbi:MAG: hypothetical protein EHM18_07740 [Acidobacteria bacterium]|nr:MAG: hypothetical protein EHM18_13565 [Acidobacteriota bacterium]RPJ86142.1 MAG: hypothetical protein EHM18_07740 [Acidobacteriota bacterium]
MTYHVAEIRAKEQEKAEKRLRLTERSTTIVHKKANMDRRTHAPAAVSILIFCLAGSVALAAGGSSLPYIGQLASSYALLDGVPAPQGTTVFTDSLITTKERPATVQLRNGSVVQIAAHSSAFFELTAPKQVQVAVRSGSIRYSAGNGQFTSAASPTRLLIGQTLSGQPILSNSGVVCVLTEGVTAGTNMLVVNDTSNIDKEGRLLIKSTDGTKYEVHYITSVQGNRVYLDRPLENSYSPQDLLIQGCACDKALGLPEDGMMATLLEEVAPNTSVLKLNPIAPLDPKAKLLIKRADGSIKEEHTIAAYNGTDMVTLGEKLKNSFEPGDMLIQGCQVETGGGAFPVWKTALLGAAAGAAGATSAVIIWEDCPPCTPCEPCPECPPVP